MRLAGAHRLGLKIGIPSLLLFIVSVAAILNLGEVPVVIGVFFVVIGSVTTLASLFGILLGGFIFFSPNMLREVLRRRSPRTYVYIFPDDDSRESDEGDQRKSE
jgi:hypothetical protein